MDDIKKWMGGLHTIEEDSNVQIYYTRDWSAPTITEDGVK